MLPIQLPTPDRTLTSAGLYGSGVGSMQELYNWPQTYNLKNYINPDGTQHRIYAATITDLANDVDNPYWIINQDKLTSKTSRLPEESAAILKLPTGGTFQVVWVMTNT
jgi:hypothetical protein